MSGSITHALSRLDRLVRLCKEASYELDLAKNHLRDPHLQAILTVGIAAHAGAARKFEDRIAACDRALAPAPSLLSTPSAGSPVWAEMSQAVARDDPGAILQICESGERELLVALNDVADDADVDETTRMVVRRHVDEVASLGANLHSARESVLHHPG